MNSASALAECHTRQRNYDTVAAEPESKQQSHATATSSASASMVARHQWKSSKKLQPIPEHSAVTQPQHAAAAAVNPPMTAAKKAPAKSLTAVSKATAVTAAGNVHAPPGIFSNRGKQSNATEHKSVSAAQASSKITGKKHGSKADSAHIRAPSNASSAFSGKFASSDTIAASAGPSSALPPQAADVQVAPNLAHVSHSKQVRFADPVSTVLGASRKSQQRQQTKPTPGSAASGASVRSTTAAVSAKASASKKRAAVTAAAGASGPVVAEAPCRTTGPSLSLASAAQPKSSTALDVPAAQSAGSTQSAASAMLPSTNGELLQYQWKQLLNAAPHDAAASASHGEPAAEDGAGKGAAARGIAVQYAIPGRVVLQHGPSGALKHCCYLSNTWVLICHLPLEWRLSIHAPCDFTLLLCVRVYCMFLRQHSLRL